MLITSAWHTNRSSETVEKQMPDDSESDEMLLDAVVVRLTAVLQNKKLMLPTELLRAMAECLVDGRHTLKLDDLDHISNIELEAYVWLCIAEALASEEVNTKKLISWLRGNEGPSTVFAQIKKVLSVPVATHIRQFAALICSSAVQTRLGLRPGTPKEGTGDSDVHLGSIM